MGRTKIEAERYDELVILLERLNRAGRGFIELQILDFRQEDPKGHNQKEHALFTLTVWDAYNETEERIYWYNWEPLVNRLFDMLVKNMQSKLEHKIYSKIHEALGLTKLLYK